MGLITRFIHVTRQSNTFANYSVIDRRGVNHNRSLAIFVTHNKTPSEFSPVDRYVAALPSGDGPSNPHHLAVVYLGQIERWAIVNIDGASMPLGMAFFVYAAVGRNYLVVRRSTSAHSECLIDHSEADNTPNAFIFVQRRLPEEHGESQQGTTLISLSPRQYINVVHRQIAILPPQTNEEIWQPASYGPERVPSREDLCCAVGVRYSVSSHKWSVVNLNGQPIADDAEFNVWITGMNYSSHHEHLRRHIVNNPSPAYNSAFASPEFLSSSSTYSYFITQNLSGGGTGSPNNHPIGVWRSPFDVIEVHTFDDIPTEVYHPMGIFNEDLAGIPEGVVYNTYHNSPVTTESAV